MREEFVKRDIKNKLEMEAAVSGTDSKFDAFTAKLKDQDDQIEKRLEKATTKLDKSI